MLTSNIELDRHFLYQSIAIPGAADVVAAVADPVANITIDSVVVIDAMVVAVIVAADAVLFVSALPAPVRQKHFHCPELGSEPEVAAETSQIPVTNVDRASAVAVVNMGLASAAGMNYIRLPSGAWASGFPLWEEQRVFRRLKWLKSSAFSACPVYFADLEDHELLLNLYYGVCLEVCWSPSPRLWGLKRHGEYQRPGYGH